MSEPDHRILRPPAERLHAAELAALAAADGDPRPPGWRLSPRAVCTFVCGSGTTLFEIADAAGPTRRPIARKFHGDDALVERCTVTLAGNRALLLIGEPGTAKSLLSELLAAAICGTSLRVVQGTAATTEDQVRYSWNYAMLLARGPSPDALVPSALHSAMRAGEIARFEEITRCPPEVQDTLVSILSEKAMTVPELPGDDGMLFARPGFNLIATANVRDRGVHEMSSALKRRFSFETVRPIGGLADETQLVRSESERLLREASAPAGVPLDVIELLVSAFQDLRTGTTAEGIAVERTAGVLSTAEAVSVAFAAGLDAWYFGRRAVGPAELGRHFPAAVIKENDGDRDTLRQYLASVRARRAAHGGWSAFSKGVGASLDEHRPAAKRTKP